MTPRCPGIPGIYPGIYNPVQGIGGIPCRSGSQYGQQQGAQGRPSACFQQYSQQGKGNGEYGVPENDSLAYQAEATGGL